MPTQSSRAEDPNRTITEFDVPFSIDATDSDKQILLTVIAECTKLIRPLHSAILYKNGNSQNLAIEVARLEKYPLHVTGHELSGGVVSVVSDIGKLDPAGIQLTQGQMTGEIELHVHYTFETEDGVVIAHTDVTGLYPLRVLESFRTVFPFN